MTEPAATILCPVCDAPNAVRSLFCAECGTPLNSDEEDTASMRSGPAASDSQSTAVIPSSRSRSDAPPSPMPYDDPDATSVAPAAFVPPDEANPYIYSPVEHPESRRGFWLGIVALVLILIILGMWIWGGVLAADTRSSVRDLFG